ncbi:MAG: glycosyltransferase family 4 protein [Leptolyngbyaceae bacterium]|nr:glycosyltransferase family 4 protein [Leptolyngbyaceae bacterium]
MSKLLFVSTRPFYPESSGGAQKSTLFLFKRLQQLGWDIEVMCGLSIRSALFRKVVFQSLLRGQKPSRTIKDDHLGYPCWRRMMKFSQPPDWIKWLDQRLDEFQPDTVIGYTSSKCPLLNHAAQRGFSSFYFVRELSSIESGQRIPDKIHAIANSPFTASKTESVSNNKVGVVLPFIDLERYQVDQRDRRYITFINPVPEKGVELAIEVARQLPNERFLFVKGKWTRYDRSRQEAFLRDAYLLPNVDVIDHQSDMRAIYQMTDILLVPSQFTETFGRVIVEAQVNRIPVIAAHIGGIPYTMGDGGILVDPIDRPEGYVHAIQHLRRDEATYHRLAHLAHQNSQRAEFDPHYQVERFLDFIQSQKVVLYT